MIDTSLYPVAIALMVVASIAGLVAVATIAGLVAEARRPTRSVVPMHAAHPAVAAVGRAA